MWFSKQEHWSGFPCPPPEDLPDLDIELTYLMSPALAARFFTTRATWEAPQHKDNWMLTDPMRTTKNGSLSQRYTWSSHIVVVQLLSYVWLFVTPWTAACQVSLSFTISQSLLKLMSFKSVIPSNHLIFCHPLLLLPSIFPSIRVFSNELAVCIRWPEYWSFSFSISPSSEYSGLISFRINWLMKVKEKSEKSGLQLNIQKIKIIRHQVPSLQGK